MTWALPRPYKLSRRRLFKVLVGYTGDCYPAFNRGYYKKVWANSAEDAVALCDHVALYCGELDVKEIHE
jgi:hypothetical protein